MRMAADRSISHGSDSHESHSYSIFMLVLIVFSLVIMVLLLLPLNDATIQALLWFDNAICVVFLADFAVNLARSHPPRDYFIGRRGWLDLIGSMPALVALPATGLLRLARISRLLGATPMLGRKNRKELVRDVLRNRGQYALLITGLAAFLVLVVSTLLMVQFESGATGANITTGGDALWWSFATITTVGYGDEVPVTALGRTVAVIVMFAGVAIIGSLASILASYLVPQPDSDGAEPGPIPTEETGAQDLASLRSEIAALRQELAGRRTSDETTPRTEER